MYHKLHFVSIVLLASLFICICQSSWSLQRETVQSQQQGKSSHPCVALSSTPCACALDFSKQTFAIVELHHLRVTTIAANCKTTSVEKYNNDNTTSIRSSQAGTARWYNFITWEYDSVQPQIQYNTITNTKITAKPQRDANSSGWTQCSSH